jgi:PIN domain
VPTPRAVIDADVLYRRHPRNLLVWHALSGLFRLHWSARILDETRRGLIERNVSRHGEPRPEDVDRTLTRFTGAIERTRTGSLVPDAEIAAYEPHMPNHPKDRHVLAAAVATGATVVVTTNIRDFVVYDAGEFRVEPQTPDDFLTSLLNEATRDSAMGALERHAAFHGWTVPQLLALLANARPSRPALAPRYVERIAELTGFTAGRDLGDP